jgi:hypothetical protein
VNTIEKAEEIEYDRRRFLGVAAMSVTGARLGMISSASAESGENKTGNYSQD